MLFKDSFVMDISTIEIAHKFVLDKVNKCHYPNGRSTYGMVYGTEGTAEYIFNSGERLIISEGDILLLSPNTSYSIDTKKPFRHYTVNFKIHKKTSSLDVMDKPYCLLKSGGSEQFSRSFNKLTKIWTQRKAGYEMLAVSTLYALIAFFYSEYKDRTAPADFAKRLHPAKEYIDQNFDTPVTLDFLAKMCSMSVTNFRREWQRVYHNTPMQHRDDVRISYAKDYLSTGYYAVWEVAKKCGFENTGYFVRFFEKHAGMSPGAFKKQALLL